MTQKTKKDLEEEIKILQERVEYLVKHTDDEKPQLVADIGKRSDTLFKELQKAAHLNHGGALALNKHMDGLFSVNEAIEKELEEGVVTDKQVEYAKKTLTRCIRLCENSVKTQEILAVRNQAKAEAYNETATHMESLFANLKSTNDAKKETGAKPDKRGKKKRSRGSNGKS